MNLNNANQSEIEYQLQLQERRRDAKLRSAMTAKIINGDVRIGQFDSVVGSSKQFLSKKKESEKQ